MNVTPPRTINRRPWKPAIGLLLLCGPPVLWLAGQYGKLEIDVANHALKSVGTREATDMELMREQFGDDQDLLLSFSSTDSERLESEDLDRIARIRTRLSQLPGIASVDKLPNTGTDLECLVIALDSTDEDSTAIADRATNLARDTCPRRLTVHATGQPLAESAIASELQKEHDAIVPIIAVAMIGLLWSIYRSLRVAIIAIMPAAASIVCVGGMFHLGGYQTNPVATLLDPVLLTVGIMVSVHMIEAYARNRPSHGLASIAAQVRRELWAPTTLATITTMAGFLSLLMSPIPAIATFGIFGAFGVALAASMSLAFVPTWLAFAVDSFPSRYTGNSTQKFVTWIDGQSRNILAITACAGASMLFAMSHLEIDNDPLRILGPQTTLRQDTDWLAAQLGGIDRIGLWIPHDSPAIASANFEQFSAIIAEEPGVVALDPRPRLSRNGDALLSARIEAAGSAKREHLFDSIETQIAVLGFPEVHVVGTAVQIARDSATLIRSQLAGLAILIPLLAVCIALGLRSWRLGLLSLIPNALPGILLYGSMAITNKPLSVATVMIGATMMGLIVDDTVHLLHCYRRSLLAGRPQRLAVIDALAKVGRPVTITSVVLAIGLGAGALGNLETTIEFSLLASSTVLVAWLLDVAVLPALLLRTVDVRDAS